MGQLAPALTVRVVFDDPPYLISLLVGVDFNGWSGVAGVYCDLADVVEAAERLLEWSRAPSGDILLTLGADSWTGTASLRFFICDGAMHPAVRVEIADWSNDSGVAWPLSYEDADKCERLAVSIPTELGLVESFAQALHTHCTGGSEAATLLPTN